jgi:amino acid permease
MTGDQGLTPASRHTYMALERGSEGGVVKPKATWVSLCWLMLSDIVGTSVLSFSGVAAKLGWVWTLVLIAGMCPVAIYSAVLMARTHLIVPRAVSMGDAAKHVFGPEYEVPTLVLVYGFAALGQGSYLLVLGQAFQGVVYDREMCLSEAVAIGCLVCVPFIISMRRLVESVVLCFANTLLIIIVIVLVSQALMSEGRQPDVITEPYAAGLTFVEVFGGLTNILYAYTGHWMYFELMSEMENPAEFPKVFTVNGPFCLIAYLLVASIGYYYEGREAHPSFLDALPRGTQYRVASAILFAHVVVVYVLKSIVLVRFLHSRSSSRFDTDSRRARIEYALWALMLLALGSVVAQAVPFFNLLLGLIGGLLAAPTSFLLPAFLYFAALTNSDKYPGRPMSLRFHIFRNELSTFDLLCFCGMILIASGTMIMGTYDVILQIVDKIASAGLPFACHLLEKE